MPLQISRNDIRNIKADAIVDPTDRYLSGYGGNDLIIHTLAGSELDKECAKLSLEPGEALITKAYDLSNYKYIIHTCSTRYIDGTHGEEEILKSCYVKCLDLAKDYELEFIVFPLIASGTFGFPKGRALKIASDTITEFLLDNELDVQLLVYDKESFDVAGKLFTDIKDYLDKYLSPKHGSDDQEYKQSFLIKPSIKADKKQEADHETSFGTLPTGSSDETVSFLQNILYDFEEAIPKFEPDESFSQCLIRMIDERGLLDPEVYKKANIDRKHFNHIKNDINYRPKKETAVALAIGMKLNLKDTDTLLERAGFVLSKSSKFDLIIRYCISHKIYDIYRINEILFAEDQKLLGC